MANSLNFDKTVTSPFHRAFPVRVTISNKLAALWHGPSPLVRSFLLCALCSYYIHVTKHRESVCVNSVQATALHQSQRAIQMEHHLPLLVLFVFFVRTTRDIHLYVYNKWSSFNYTIQTSPQARPTATKTKTKQGSQKAPPTESHYEIHTIRTQFCKWFPSP